MSNSKSYPLSHLAELTQTTLKGNPHHTITNVADLETATPSDASFLSNSRYQQSMIDSQAGVIFIAPNSLLIEGKNYLISEQPSRAFQKVVDLIHPQSRFPSAFTGIHATAVIHPTAIIEEDVTISPYVVIDAGTVIKKRSFIGAHVYIGRQCEIGEDCLIHPHVTLREHSILNNRVIIQPGAVIGSCGFGYTTSPEGVHQKLNQVGNVVLEADVEIGANATIDRSRFKSTLIQAGTKIDNLVQIGHGVILGKHNIIIAQTAIAGSSTTGRNVVLAGQVAVAGHLHLDDGVIVAGKSGVTKSLRKGTYNGVPAQPVNEYNRTQVYLRNIQRYVKQLQDIETRIKKIESVF